MENWTLKRVRGDEETGMRLDLNRHPQTRSQVGRVVVSIGRDADILRVTFRLPDDSDALRLPALGEPRRGDRLWERTCFELFIRAVGDAGYYEYNLSPSRAWAIYRFDDYRAGMAEADFLAPAIDAETRGARFELSARISIPSLGALDWRLGLSAVIEETNGTKSYWALAHPPGAPDFHHPDCFALRMPRLP